MFSSKYVLLLDSKINTHCFDSSLKKDSAVKILTTDNLSEGFEYIKKYEPDLILLYDNFNEDSVSICKKLRKETGYYRPVIMVLSGTKQLDEKLKFLKAGADDFQSDSIDEKELSLRIFAHLRRHIEELANPVTNVAGSNFSYRILKRTLLEKTDNKYALMYIDIGNFTPYKDVYGHIASEKLLQTFIAIIKTAINEDDFLGQVGNETFIILTSQEKAEKIAIFLCYSFDMVSQKFYTNEDIDRGYLIVDGDEKIGRRIPFASVSIGIVSNQYKNYQTVEELINNVISVHRLAKHKPGSFWISDRPRIEGKAGEIDDKRKILIIENDAALSYLLITTLEMQGYNAESINSIDQTLEMIEKTPPSLIVFDINEENAEKALELCRQIKKKYSNIKIIVSTVDCNKEKILDTGVDLYIPKPYELMILFSWISRFLNYEVIQ